MNNSVHPAEVSSDVQVTHMVRLTSSELSSLWKMFMNYTMLLCMCKVFLNHTQDPDIKVLVQDAINLAQTRINKSKDFLSQDGRDIPIGFTDEDIVLNAPALHSDIFYLYYLRNEVKIGLNLLSTALPMCTRLDILVFLQQEIQTTTEFWNKIARVMLEKGIIVRPPFIETKENSDYVEDKQEFLGSYWGRYNRPLLAMEVEQLFYAIITNEVGKTLLTGFHQVTPSKPLRDYIARGIALATDIIEDFSQKLLDSGITAPSHWEAYGAVSSSTIPPFSDKLMMFHINLLNSAGLANYAVSAGSTFRKDLILMYGRYLAQITKYTAEGVNLAIENKWFEEPPRYVDRKDLINTTTH